MKLLLHIGTDKTGSTAIQKHLYVNRQWFLERGVYVPETGLGKDNGHGEMLTAMEPGQLSHLAKELLQAEEDGYLHAVISWEGMSYMGKPEIDQLTAALPTKAPWLLVYLREQADIIQTSYLQEIKTEKCAFSIADFQGIGASLTGLRALLYCYSPRRNYARLLRRWMPNIPRGQVTVREYSRSLLVNENIIDDFLANFSLQPDAEFIRLAQATNISLDVESAIIVNSLDRQDDGTPPRKTSIFTLLSLIDSDGFGFRYFLSARRVASIRRYYARSNRTIADITGAASQPLFAAQQPCARTYDSEVLQQGIDRRRQLFESLQTIPMLFTTKHPHDTPRGDILTTGWCEPQGWGAWSQGSVSEVRFRVPFWMTGHEKASVIIYLKGRYAGRNTRSQVSVNNQEYGWLDLRRFTRTIALPVAGLGANQKVVVRIHHEFADEAGKLSGDRPTAFGIEQFGIQFSNPE